MLDREGVTKFLSGENIRCRDTAEVTQKICEMKKDGYSALQILADFDYTISHFRFEKEKMSSSFGALEKYSGMSEEFRAKTLALYNHFYPQEVDPNIPAEVKVGLMTEWFTKSAGCIISEGVSKETVKNAADTSKVKLRGKFDVFAETLKKEEVPLLVFSAGVGQVIERVFSNAKISPDNIKLIANMLEFNSENNAEQFRPPLITTGNKSTVAAQEKEYFNSHIDRVNSILLGDNIEDIQMSACVRNYSKNVLTVGFLNDRVEDRLDLYKSTFDVVILNDPDFTDVIQLFECLQ